MDKYLAIFLGSKESMDAWMALDETSRKEKETTGTQAWKDWAQSHATFIIDIGSPLGKTKKITKDGITDIRNELGAWCMVQAESQDEAAALFLNHPHFMIFPGDAVEVMECRPMPI